ncbi:MAG: ATP-binding protein [Euryarchaeota archaeon]|nr:ATP-binding protein [Euryarchaeota archaeon]
MEPELVNNFSKFCEIRANHNGSEYLDLTHHKFFYPTTLLPTLGFIIENSLKVRVNPNVHGYVSIILNPSKRRKKSYVPFRELTPDDKSARDQILQEILKLTDESYGGIEALDYLVYELTNNIYEHSEFERAFIMAQKYPKKNFIEICFFDNGISIPGNFLRHEIHYENDADAIDKAVNGISTKDEFRHRGWGINTIVNIFTKGANGEIFIASRNGAIYISSNDPLLYKLGDKYRIDGTLISLRIPRGYVNISSYL